MNNEHLRERVADCVGTTVLFLNEVQNIVRIFGGRLSETTLRKRLNAVPDARIVPGNLGINVKPYGYLPTRNHPGVNLYRGEQVYELLQDLEKESKLRIDLSIENIEGIIEREYHTSAPRRSMPKRIHKNIDEPGSNWDDAVGRYEDE